MLVDFFFMKRNRIKALIFCINTFYTSHHLKQCSAALQGITGRQLETLYLHDMAFHELSGQ